MEKLESRAMSASLISVVYNLDPGTLANLRSQRKGPKFFKVGRKVYYRPEDVESWLFSNPVHTMDSVRSAES